MQKRGNKLADASSKMIAGTEILSMTINSVHANSVCKAGLTIYKSFSLGTRKSVRCPYLRVSVLSELFFKEMYEVFVEANKTVLNTGVSVLSGVPL